MNSKKILIAYAAGPGDVIGTYRHWVNGDSDPHEVSETYSGQFFRQVRDLSMRAYVISSHPRKEVVNDDWITIENRPKSSHGKSGIVYHIADLVYWLGIIRTIVRSGARIAVISDMEHWWLLILLKFARIKVVPSLHCTFWPKGHRHPNMKDRVIQKLNGIFWRYIPDVTISISLECENQVRELAGHKVKGKLLQARPYYYRGYFDSLPLPDWNLNTFGLLFAGRIERNKGVFDLLDLAEELRNLIPGRFVIEVCGFGSAQNEFIAEISRRQLSDTVHFLGRLDRHDMLKAYERALVTLVLTTSNFAEGLNKTVVESVLAGRPVVATDICPAVDLVQRSVVQVPAGDLTAMSDAIIRLASEQGFYESLQKYCKSDAMQFYDFDNSWGAALRDALAIETTR